MKTRRRRYSVTLIEMIIVMLLIASITGALAYSYRDTLSEGKAFKSRQGIKRIEAILTMYLYSHPGTEKEIETGWKEIVSTSTLGKGDNGTCELLKDGWGKDYLVSATTSDEDGEAVVHVKSQALENFDQRHSVKKSSP